MSSAFVLAILLTWPATPSGASDDAVVLVLEQSESSTATASETSDDAEVLVLDGHAESSSEVLSNEKVRAWTPRARGSAQLELRLAADTAHEGNELIAEFATALRLELEVELSPSVSAYAAPRLSWVGGLDADGGDRELLYLVPPEAQLSFRAGPWRVRAGTLLFAWGASDLLAPSDILNPLDLRGGGLFSGASAKIPVPAVEAVLALRPLTLRAVVEPFFTPSRLFLVGWDFALLQGAAGSALPIPELEGLFSRAAIDHHGDLLLLTERPPDRMESLTAAGRATLELETIELSATFVHGWDVLPRVVLNPDLLTLVGAFTGGREAPFSDPEVIAALVRVQQAVEDGRTLARGSYLRRTLVGLDAAWTIDPIVLKLDVAYTFGRTLYTQALQPVTQPWLNAVAGFEYAHGEALQVLVEGFAVAVPGVPDNVRLLYLEANSPPPSMEPKSERTVMLGGLASALRFAPGAGDIRGELLLAWTITRGDLVMVPRVAWRFAPSHELSLGALFVEGQTDGYGGAYDKNDQVFISWRFAP